MISDAQKLQFLTQRLDPRKTVIVCGKHNYVPDGPRMPESQCSDCWFAFLFHHIAQLPPDKQAEKLEQLEAAMHHAFEYEDRGQFDAKINRHPKIVIEKGSA